MTGYVIEHNDQQYDPNGRVSVLDTNTHNMRLDTSVIDDARLSGKGTFYLCRRVDTSGPEPYAYYEVITWAGTWRSRVNYRKKSYHNFAGRDGRRDVWFRGPDGKQWHGVNIGDSDLVHCKRIGR